MVELFFGHQVRREAEVRYDVFQRLDMEEKLRKADKRELIAAKKLVEEKEKEERCVVREAAKEVREKEKANAAIKKAERQAEKPHQKQERDAAKAIQLSQKGKRKASQVTGSKKRQKRVHTGDVGGDGPLTPSPAPPPITTRRSRSVNLPAKSK